MSVGQAGCAARRAIFARTVFQSADGTVRTFVQRTFVGATFLTGCKEFKRSALAAGRADFRPAVANQISRTTCVASFVFFCTATVTCGAVNFITFFGCFFISVIIACAWVADAFSISGVIRAKAVRVKDFALTAAADKTCVGTSLRLVLSA